MIIVLCILLWLLLGFVGVRLMFIATQSHSYSLCYVLGGCVFGIAMFLVGIVEFLTSEQWACPHPEFFKRKYK